MRRNSIPTLLLVSLLPFRLVAEPDLNAPWPTEITLPVLAADRLPKMDGVIDEPEWTNAAVVLGAFKDERNLDEREYAAYLAASADTLFIALRTRTEENAELRAAVKPETGTDQIKTFFDDSIEIWLAPDKENGSGPSYQVILNSLGAQYDAAYSPENKQDESFRMKRQYAGKINGGEWRAEIAIPLAQFRVKTGQPFGLRLVRNFGKQVDWTPVAGAFNVAKTMGTVRLAAGAPVVRQLSLLAGNGEGADIQFEVKNPGKQPLEIAVQTYSLAGDGNQEKTSKNQYNLKPGETKPITVEKSKGLGIYKNFIRVTSADGKQVYFARKFNWRCRQEEVAGQSARSAAFPLQFAYYPSFNKIRAKVDLRRLEDKEKVTGVQLRVKDQANGKTLAEFRMPAFKDFVSETSLDIPKLPQGRYLLEAQLEGTPDRVSAREFVRNIYEWENNTLGISAEVIPPYTPLVVKDRNVSAVLRTYSLNRLGLPDQVMSEGKPILARPITLDVVVAKQNQPIEVTKPLQFTRVKPNEIEYVSEWKTGPLRGALRGSFDYDGMLKLELQFRMENDAALEKLDLLIPMDPKIASRMHVISDGSRYSFINRIPEGTDAIWKSKSLPHSDMPDPDYVVPNLPGAFVPYFWLGNERQGLSWFADNDKDWLFDDSKSTHVLYREKEAILLKISFVKAPAPLKRAHQIVFGLQATPTKPMPEKPDHWRRTVFRLDAPGFSNLLNVTILGSCWQWGGEALYDYYPRNKDFTVYQLIKATRDGDYQPAEWNRWLDGYDRENPAYERIRRNMSNGMYAAKARPDVIIPYTDARGVPLTTKEFETFQDEWLIYKYTSRKWPRYCDGAMGYYASVARSYQDFILHYYNRMLESGAFDAIYFDCTYLKAVRDPVCTSAYLDDHGNLRAGCDLFALRELFKRCAVLAHQKRGYNLNVAHMTSALAAPLHTWFGTTLDWEFHAGLDDFQDRFSQDYIRTITLGQQTGAVPLVLGSTLIRGEDAGKISWVLRTLAGCVLAHEIREWAVGWGKNTTYTDALKKLYDFGYGRPECAVHNYWQEHYPASVKGVDSASLLLAKDGEALMVITDYGNGGKCELALDAAALKLKKDGKFHNAETGEVLPASGSACAFDLKKHDFIMLHYR